MKCRKFFGILSVVAGIALIGFAYRLHQSVEAGQMQVAQQEGQKKRERLAPIRHEIAESSNASLQQKINHAIAVLGQREETANWIQIGGVVLVILGAVVLLKRRHQK